MPRYRTLVDLPQLPVGTIGEEIPNDFDKYDLKLDCGEIEATMPVSGKKFKCRRTLYFYRDEVEEVVDGK